MTTPEMVIYWREAAEAAEAKVIEQRERIRELELKAGDSKEEYYRQAKRVADLLTANQFLKDNLRELKQLLKQEESKNGES